MAQRQRTGSWPVAGTAMAAVVILATAACGSSSPGSTTTPSSISASAPASAPATASHQRGSTGASSAVSTSGTSNSSHPSSGTPKPGGGTDLSAPTIPPRKVPLPTGAPVGPGSGHIGGKSELTGTVEAGVESGCLVLTDAGGAVVANLIGLDAATTPVGTEVVVTGEFQQDLMTTCQQGSPFVVASVKKR